MNTPQAVLTCDQATVTVSSKGLPQCIPMNPTQFGLVSSSYTLGGFVGALIAGPVATKSGRLPALRGTTVFFILGSAIEAVSSNIPLLVIGRFLSGIGAGASIVVGPIFISEVAPPASRGFFGAFTQVMTNVGILLASLLGYFLSRGSLWRVILAVGAALGLTKLLGLLVVPETPTWLAEHERTAQARKVLQRIRGRDADIEAEVKAWSAFANSEAAEERQSLLSPPPQNAPARSPPVTIFNVITDPKNRAAVYAVVVVMISQQFTGINSIIMYSVSLLQDTFPTGAPLLAILISVLNLVVTAACSPLPDRIGRKTCLLLSITGMGLASMLLALGISVNQKALSAVASLSFVASFAVGLGPVPFILASELVGPEAVGATQSWALAANWVSTFIVAQFFPMLNMWLGGHGRIYWIFAALAALFGSLIAWFVPETKGKANADAVWGRERNLHRD